MDPSSRETSGAATSTPVASLSKARENLISHALSRILRHEAPAHGLHMSRTGYVALRDLLKVPALKGEQVRATEVRTAVMINGKQRFQIMTEDNTEYVRAVQGHDSAMAAHYGLSSRDMLQELTEHTAPEMAVHGTQLQRYSSVRADGLHRGKRTHTHFVSGNIADTARSQDSEVSGLRANAEILLWVNIRQCFRQGIEFYEAPNSVLLSPGKKGYIPPSCIAYVQLASNGMTVTTRGRHHLPTHEEVLNAMNA